MWSAPGSYFMYEADAYQPVRVGLLDNTRDVWASNWTAAGHSDAPFYAWALHVDSQGSMYISDRPRLATQPYGRVTRLAWNGSETGQWTMQDGTAYSFHSIAYDSLLGSNSTGAYWLADREQGVVQATARGALLLPFYQPPVDESDRRAAVFVGMAVDEDVSLGISLLLLDIADPTTTKLWRFSTATHVYTLLNTSSARLSANISHLAVNSSSHAIIVYNAPVGCIIQLHADGALDVPCLINYTDVGEPAGILCYQSRLYVTDTSYGPDRNGALLRFEIPGGTMYVVPNDFGMWRPRHIAMDNIRRLMYLSDSNGRLFQLDRAFALQDMHDHLPEAHNISSLTVGGAGRVYLVDALSRRLIVVMATSTGWNWGDSSSSVSSSSSTASYVPAAPTRGSASAVVISLSVLGALTAVAGAGCLVVHWRKRRQRGVSSHGMQMHELLLPTRQHGERSEQRWRADTQKSEAASAPGAYANGQSDGSAVSSSAVSRRYDYYVARYEVVAAVSQLAERRHDSSQQPHSQSGHLPRSFVSLAVAANPAGRASSATSSIVSTELASRTPTPDVYAPSPSSAGGSDGSRTSSLAPSSSRSGHAQQVAAAALALPMHIDRLQSTMHAVPIFIDSVTDLTILGEGSSGVVYCGMYKGAACVVKLPKAFALSGAAWREWQCHMSLPPHANLVRFLGALLMQSTNYLVLGLVRQGNLHSLLHSAASYYCRPYAVMRCMRDMCAALRHIHAVGIVHRDVSCRNILVDSDGSMVLADLGLAEQVVHSDMHAQAGNESTTAVPVRWTSPEALQTRRYDSRSDVWSLGVALWECTASGALPYGEQQLSTRACIRPIVTGELRLSVDGKWGRALGTGEAEQRLADRVMGLIQLCLTHDARHRPNSEELVAEVERQWREWRAEAGPAATALERSWLAYHEAVQSRLAVSTKHSSLSDGASVAHILPRPLTARAQ